MKKNSSEECRDCKTVLYLSFGALLSLFILAYLTRPGDAPLASPDIASSTTATTSSAK